MKTTDTMYIVHYTQRDRAEGGPIITRHFATETEARAFVERLRRDPELLNPEIIKQVAVITKERIL